MKAMKKLILLCLLLISAVGVYGQSTVPAGLDNTSMEDWNVLRLTNNERMRAGLPILLTNNMMQYAASMRAYELLTLYSHTRPSGQDPFSVLDEQNYFYTSAAENIAQGQKSPEHVLDSWMNSSGHRKNILTANLRFMGAGYRNNGTPSWVQLFATQSNTDCTSVEFDEASSSFVFTLANGTTAYAPYDANTFYNNNGQVTVNYPGVTQPVLVSVTTRGEGRKKKFDNGRDDDESNNDNGNGDRNNGGGGGGYSPSDGPDIGISQDDTPSGGDYGDEQSIDFKISLMGKDLSVEGSTPVLNSGGKGDNFTVEPIGNYTVYVISADGQYLGVEGGESHSGAELTFSSEKFEWMFILGDDASFSLRPSDALGLAVGAEELSRKGGTQLVLIPYENIVVPESMEFTLQ